jgi:outer membrane lipoprotein SlyB
MCSLGSDGHISIYKLNIIIERVDTFADTFVGAFVGAFAGAFVGAFAGAFVGAFAGAFADAFAGAFADAFADKGKVEEDKVVEDKAEAVVEDNTVAGSSAAADKD